MQIVEGDDLFRFDSVKNSSHPRSPAREEFGIIESVFETLDPVRCKLPEQPFGRNGNILGVALEREEECRRIAVAAFRFFLQLLVILLRPSFASYEPAKALPLSLGHHIRSPMFWLRRQRQFWFLLG